MTDWQLRLLLEEWLLSAEQRAIVIAARTKPHIGEALAISTAKAMVRLNAARAKAGMSE